MVHIEFLGPIQKDARQMQASNLSEVATELSKDPEIKAWLESCAVAVNDTLVGSLEHPLKEGDKISLLPPVCGG